MRHSADFDRLEAAEVPRWREDANLVAVSLDEGPCEVVDEAADAVFAGSRVRARQKEDSCHRAGISPQAAAC